MREKIHLSISQPCSAKWEEFKPVKGGCFCDTCSKTIIDFTKKNDDEIVQFFMNKPSGTCGRFRQDQVRSYINTTNIETGFPLLKAGLLSLVMLLFHSKESSSQSLPAKIQTEAIQSDQLKTEKTLSSDYIVSGVVRGKEDGEPLPGISIVLKGTTMSTTTDENGKFEFPGKLKAGDMLVFTFIGYLPQQYRVVDPGTNDVSIWMDMDMTTLDLVVMGEVRVSHDSSHLSLHKLWVNIKSLF